MRIGAIEYRENLVLTPEAIATGWAPSGFDGLAEADFARLLSYKPEVVLFGGGPTIRFPHPRLTRALTEARIGLEAMDTAGGVPNVQHPRGGGTRRRGRVAAGLNARGVRAAGRHHWHAVPGRRNTSRVIGLTWVTIVPPAFTW